VPSSRLRPVAALLLTLAVAASPFGSAAPFMGPNGGPVAVDPALATLGGEGEHAAMRVPPAGAATGAADRTASPPSVARGPVPLATPANWTMLVYMVADNDLEPFGIEDLNEMEAAPDHPDVRVAVQVDRSSRYDTSNGDWSTTRRYEVRHDSDSATVGSLFLADLGEQNMGDPQTLADFLVWGADTYPADHYLVVVWDHGYGWSGGIGNDLGNGDHLSIAELSSALAVGADHLGRPFDIVAFDACLMQQVEVLYEIAWVADFFVGAQDLEPATGWPYEEMVAALGLGAGSAPRSVAADLSSAYIGFYGTQGDSMMSAVDAAALRTVLSAALNRLASELSALVEDPATMGDNSVERAIWNARDQSPAMFITDYIDLGEFARRLEADARLPAAARSAASALHSAINATVFAESHSVYRPGLTGITTYLPGSSVPLRYADTRWARDSLWDEFIVAYLSGVPVVARPPTLTVSAPSEGTTVARSFSGSFSATQPGADDLTLQVKVRWGDWTTFAAGAGNFSATSTFDAGPSEGPRTVSFRAVGALGVPSPTIERKLQVVADPVALDPRPAEFVVAQNRTATLSLNATLRNPFASFTVGWRNLPPGVTNAGGTSFTPPSPGTPVAVQLVLAAAPGAGPGAPVVAVFSPAGAPALETVLALDLVVTQPFPDLAVSPLVLDDPLPWPGDVVNVTAVVSNEGFDDAPGARVVAGVVFNGTNSTERLNLTVGALAPGATAPVAFNWTVLNGHQRVFVRVEPDPPFAERTPANNERQAEVNMTSFGLRVTGPGAPVAAADPGNTTAVLLRIDNVGTQGDNYTASAAIVAGGSAWGVALPPGAIPLDARTNTTLALSVTTPPGAWGGELLALDVRVASLGQSGLEAVVLVTVEFPQVHAGSIQATPDDVEVPHGGNASVAVALANLGNGPESYTVLVQNGEASLAVTASATSFGLGPGEAASLDLTLYDRGLVSADRPYAIEVVAVSSATGGRLSAIVSVRVAPFSNVSVQPIERSVELGAAASAPFHVNVTNTGNTNAVVTVSAASPSPLLEATFDGSGVLLAPGGTAVINGTATFAQPPRAGEYTLTVQAVETRGGSRAAANVTLRVPEIHDFTAAAASSPAGEPTPSLFIRTVRVENRGNVDESLLIVIGFVPIGLTVTIDPPAPALTVPAFGNASFEVRVERAAATASGGEVSITVTSVGAGRSAEVPVAYAFPAAPQDATLFWGAILGVSALGAGAWMWATRPKRSA